MKKKSNRVDFPFHEITEKEMEVERLLANMRASGSGAHLLSTAEMQAMNKKDDYEEGEEGYQQGESIDADGNTAAIVMSPQRSVVHS